MANELRVETIMLNSGTTIDDVYTALRQHPDVARTRAELRDVIHAAGLRYEDCGRLAVSADWICGLSDDPAWTVASDNSPEARALRGLASAGDRGEQVALIDGIGLVTHMHPEAARMALASGWQRAAGHICPRCVHSARDVILSAIRARAVTDATRYVQEHGISLSHDEADDMGDECLDWLRTRLGLRVTTTDTGVVAEVR